MSKEDVFVLRATLVRKPRAGFSYGKTRDGIFDKLLTFEINEKKDRLISEIGNLKVEDEKIEIPVRVNKHFLGAKDERSRQKQISEMLISLERWMGIGSGMSEDSETDKRLEQMENEGIIPIAFLREFEQKDFES